MRHSFFWGGLLLINAAIANPFMPPPAEASCPLTAMGGTIGKPSLGIATALIPDVNGDGHADWLVATTTYESGGSVHPGHVDVYFGGPASDDVPDVALSGERAGDRFGYAVASAGDFNGDGHADILVGAYLNDSRGSDCGRAYLYFGGPSLNSTADLALNGEALGDEFGIAVDGIGDVNGDGFDDVLVGARLHDTGGGTGRAYVFFGGPNPDNQADLVLDAQSSGERFGFTVSAGGDLNADGHDDFMVGAYHNSFTGTQAGRLYVYFGGPLLDATADLLLDGEDTGGHFSDGLDAADVNGDGHPDILAGASQIFVKRGRAYVYFGGPLLDTTADLVLDQGIGGEWFGRCVAGGGDLDGDGHTDLVVGAPANSAGTPGRIYVYSGGPAVDSVPDQVLQGEAPGDLFGWHASLGNQDVTHDGKPDLLVGAWKNYAGGDDAGRAYVYASNPLDSIADIVMTGIALEVENLGIAVSIVGDLNADGFDDFIGGATSYELSANEHPGHVLVYFGGPGVDAVADRVLAGENDGDRFGYRCGPAGDVNGDGHVDLVVGAYQHDARGISTGRAYLYFGGPGFDALPDLVLTGEAAGDQFGVDVAGIGDVNLDTYDDILVGARFNAAAGIDAGRAYVYFGGPGMDDVADLSLDGHEQGERLGFSVSPAGDVNGDLAPDFVVGAHYSLGVTGRAYVYFGGAAMDALADVILEGESPGQYFSDGLGAADVNADGFDDLVVGATHPTSAGRAYIYFGGASMDATADLVLSEEVVGDWFGRSISAGGDLDGDGHVDFSVGAPAISSGSPGHVYIYRGGPNLDDEADAILEGMSGSAFGWAISTPGKDVDGDGAHDVLVGAWASTDGVGRMDLYLCRLDFLEPRILSILDVGNDQGRQVRIRFERSGRDKLDSLTPILQYELYRRIDPLPAKGAPSLATRIERARSAGMLSDAAILQQDWDFIGLVPAHGMDTYSTVAPTLADSTTRHGVYWSVFFVRAATSEPLVFFDSPPDSGYSTDDLAPACPVNFHIVSVNGNGDVELSWDGSLEADFAFHTLYRGTTPDFVPDDADLVVHIDAATTYVDAGAAQLGSLPCYYKLSSSDFAENESPFAVAGLTPTDAGPHLDAPTAFAARLGTPNPVRRRAVVHYEVPLAANLRLTVYDARGHRVRTLLDRPHGPGRYAVVWEGEDQRGFRVAPGVYFYRFESAAWTRSLKIVWLE